jgi:hypothetical protein
MVSKMKDIKEENYKKYNYIEPIFQKKVTKIDYNETEFKNSVDFKSFHTDLKKQAKYEKTKPGNAKVMEYEEDKDCVKVNILTDDIFESSANPTPSISKVKISLSEMSVKDLMKEIHFFLKKKNIILASEDIQSIQKALEDPLFEREKYIKYSKTTKMLSKLEFIKKNESGLYEVANSANSNNKIATNNNANFNLATTIALNYLALNRLDDEYVKNYLQSKQYAVFRLCMIEDGNDANYACFRIPSILSVGANSLTYNCSYDASGSTVSTFATNTVVKVFFVDEDRNFTAGANIAINYANKFAPLVSFSGILPQANGGTGYSTSYSDGEILIGTTSSGLLNKTTLTPNEVVKICCEKSWGGFNFDWVKDIKELKFLIN